MTESKGASTKYCNQVFVLIHYIWVFIYRLKFHNKGRKGFDMIYLAFTKTWIQEIVVFIAKDLIKQKRPFISFCFI